MCCTCSTPGVVDGAEKALGSLQYPRPEDTKSAKISAKRAEMVCVRQRLASVSLLSSIIIYRGAADGAPDPASDTFLSRIVQVKAAKAETEAAEQRMQSLQAQLASIHAEKPLSEITVWVHLGWPGGWGEETDNEARVVLMQREGDMGSGCYV